MRITATRSALMGILSACATASMAVPAAADSANAASGPPAPAPAEFLDARRLPLVSPVKPAERVRREEAPVAGAPDVAAPAGRNPAEDQRLLAEAEEATQRALEERARSAEVRRRAEELSARFAKDEKAKSEKTDTSARLIPAAATTESPEESAPVAAAPPPATAKPAAKVHRPERRAKAQRPPAQAAQAKVGKTEKAGKGERSALGAPVPAAPPPKEEGVLAKMKKNLSSLMGW